MDNFAVSNGTVKVEDANRVLVVDLSGSVIKGNVSYCICSELSLRQTPLGLAPGVRLK